MDGIVYNRLVNILSLEQASQYTGLAAQTLKIQADRGRLGAQRVGGVWVTTIEDVMRYVASRRKNAADVQVICHDCSRVFLTPTEAVPTPASPGAPSILGCPGCGSPAWGIAAVPDGGRLGHRLEEALRAAVADARDVGRGEAYVNDTTGAYVRIMVLGRAAQRVVFEVDRGGVQDPRDADRLREHIEVVLGEAISAAPSALYRYAFEVEPLGAPGVVGHE
jgi:hypothetical protein